MLIAARKKYFLDGLSAALGELDPNTVKAQISEYVPPDAQQILGKAGLRDEHVFPLPLVLEMRPTLLGYYRMLMGASQKAFYLGTTGMGMFRSMEEFGTLNNRQRQQLPAFCRAMTSRLAELVRKLPTLTERDLRELPILTFGSQLQGAYNTAIGEKAMRDVFLAISEITRRHIVSREAKKIVVKNSTGRVVAIICAHDPDVSIVEQIGDQVHRKVAIEVKGGTDFSNVHNRAGEAEKSHLKAKKKQFRDFWTIISKARVSMESLRTASQTTTEWFDLTEVLARSGPDWEAFQAKLSGAVGIPLPGEEP